MDFAERAAKRIECHVSMPSRGRMVDIIRQEYRKERATKDAESPHREILAKLDEVLMAMSSVDRPGAFDPQ